jgi:exopolysaccharide biosynthesis polyprenyl glycosylphosphotransferase
MRKIRYAILLGGDIALLYLSLLLTVALGFWKLFSWQIFAQHLLPFTILYLFWLIIFYIFGLYELDFLGSKLDLATRVGWSLLFCFGLGIAFFYTFPIFDITPKTNLLINVVLIGCFIFFWRRIFYSLSSSRNLQKMAFLGKNILSNSLLKKIETNPQFGYKAIGYLNSKKPLIPQIKRKRVDVLIIDKALAGKKSVLKQLYQCLPQGIIFLDAKKAYELFFYKVPIDTLDESWFLENLKEGEKKVYDKIKRIMDIIFSIIIIAATLPFWLIIPLFIKLEDKGPVFYKQKRVGKNGKTFLLWKFRSMIQGAEKKGAKWAEKDDPRITKIGRVIRKTHLDEIPQMINVLKGDISLVGPRPERPEFVKKLEKEIPYYHLRHIIKPGFTGWAQVKQFGKYARSVKDSHEKFQYDLYYIKNRSLLLDLGILLRTFQLFFFRKN